MTELEQQQFEAFCKQMQAAGDSWAPHHTVVDQDRYEDQNLASSKNQVYTYYHQHNLTLVFDNFHSVFEASVSDSSTF